MEFLEALKLSGKRVVILSGGNCSEREVSLVSGKAVTDALEAMGVPCQSIVLSENALPDGLSVENDLILPMIHGTYGEDGGLSGDLEKGGFAYGGCDQASSVLCFDKLACKAMAAHIGVPVAKDVALSAGETVRYDALVEQLGESFILKPRRDGSSVGLHLVKDVKSFEAARRDLAQWDYLAESFIEGYDLTVGVLRGNPLGIVAVHPEGGLYDYEHKYTSGMSRYEVPAVLEPKLVTQLREWTQAIYKACGCRDLSRVDFRLGKDGQVVFLEINTLPGMTPTSLLPKSAQCMGYSFETIILEWAQAVLYRTGERIS